MIRFVKTVSIALAITAWQSPALLAQSPASLPRLDACSLVTRDEVRKHLPWSSGMDQLPMEEEPLSASESACNYPSVHVQILTFRQSTIDAARKRGTLEPIHGLGDEAYFYNNSNEYAEIYVKVGKRLLTLQADVNGNMDAIKAAAVSLAKVMVAKLR